MLIKSEKYGNRSFSGKCSRLQSFPQFHHRNTSFKALIFGYFFLKKSCSCKAPLLSNFYPNISFTFEKNNRLHNYIKFVIIRLYRVDTSFDLGSLCILLTNFNKVQALPKNSVNPKWQENQKNSCRIEQIVLPNLKRSGFVFISAESKLSRELNTKQSIAVFLMSVGGEEPHCRIDKALWVLWRSKVPCLRGKERKTINFISKLLFIWNLILLIAGKMLIPNIRDSMTIPFRIYARNKYKLRKMCLHDRIRLRKVARENEMRSYTNRRDSINCN